MDFKIDAGRHRFKFMSALTFDFHKSIKLLTKMLFFPCNYQADGFHTYISIKFLKIDISLQNVSVQSLTISIRV